MPQAARNRVFHDFRAGATRNLVCSGKSTAAVFYRRVSLADDVLLQTCLPEVSIFKLSMLLSISVSHAPESKHMLGLMERHDRFSQNGGILSS